MNREQLEAKISAKFPKIQKAKVEVKNYATYALEPQDLVPFATWLKDDCGFAYLQMHTATDWKGSLSLEGFIREPNPNVFLPDGATPQIQPPKDVAGNPYRDAIECVYALQNLETGLLVFLKVDAARENGRVPSLVGLYKAADWQERETFDLFGVSFDGHPNMKKILTPDFILGNPLKKDYAHKKDRFDD